MRTPRNFLLKLAARVFLVFFAAPGSEQLWTWFLPRPMMTQGFSHRVFG